MIFIENNLQKAYFIILLYIDMINISDHSPYSQLALQLPSTRKKTTVSLLINEPIYNDYNSIQLQISTTKRIKHLKTHPNAIPIPQIHRLSTHNSFTSHSQQPQPDKWQHSLEKYIASKQKIIQKLKNSQNQFQFLKLNKMNKIRKRKLIQQNSVPIDIVNNSNIIQNFEYSKETSQEKRRNRMIKEKSTILKSEEMQLPRLYSQYSQAVASNNYGRQNDNILGNFLQKYFKKKQEDSKRRVKINSIKKMNMQLNSNRRQLHKYQL